MMIEDLQNISGYLTKEMPQSEAQPSRGTTKERDKKQIRAEEMSDMKPQANKEDNRQTALERTIGKLLGSGGGMGCETSFT